MIVQSLTKHFVDQWLVRMGETPRLDEINRLLDQSQKVRNQQQLRRFRDCEWQRYDILAEYWHNERGVIIRVDETKSAAVTLIRWGIGCLKGRGRKAEGRGQTAEDGGQRTEDGWRTRGCGDG